MPLKLVDLLPPVTQDEAPENDALLGLFLEFVEDQQLSLYPAQEQAILEYFAGRNVILNTPTGSGKSLVATAVHFQSLAHGRRSVYTSPIKALVNEKWRALCRDFGPDNVGLCTGDATVNREAPILCCTAEVLANIALREGAAAPVDDAVLDEFHWYADRDRGVAWQVPLLALPQARFLLMSATLGDTRFFEQDLQQRTGRSTVTVKSRERPVPLQFTYSLSPLAHTLGKLVEEGKAPVYVVHFTQREAAENAQAFTSINVCSREEKTALARELAEFRFTSPYGKEVRRWLRHGIGIHHAGLLPKYRVLVEQLAQKNLLKIICGTDTLGVGINVPIRTVLFTRLCKYDGEKTAILSARDFHQISGRAGRKGFDEQGWVVAQAPEHVIENRKEKEKAAAGKRNKASKKGAKRRAPDRNFVPWNEKTFQRLVAASPEQLSSQFQVSHGMLLNVLSRPGDGCRAMRDLIRACHDTPARKKAHRRRAWQLFRSLVERGIVEILDEHGRAVRSASAGGASEASGQAADEQRGSVDTPVPDAGSDASAGCDGAQAGLGAVADTGSGRATDGEPRLTPEAHPGAAANPVPRAAPSVEPAMGDGPAVPAERARGAAGQGEPAASPDGRKLRVNVELQDDFSMDQTLSLYLLETIQLVDPEQEDYALVVLTLVESILENPEIILRRQLDRIKGQAVAEMKAQGMDYEDRMAVLEELEYPKPHREFIYTTFNEFADRHPWVGQENIRPKSIAREMFESFASFSDYIQMYELQRSEGLLLRHLHSVYRTLLQTVPDYAKDTALREIELYFGETIRQADSSLLDEWEKMRDPAYMAPETTNDSAAAAGELRPDITGDEAAFTAAIRTRIFTFLRALVEENHEQALEVLSADGHSGCAAAAGPETAKSRGAAAHGEDPPGHGPVSQRTPCDADAMPWTAERLAAIMPAYLEEHQRLRLDPEGRNTRHTYVRPAEDGQSWNVQQMLVDPEAHNDWVAEFGVDLPQSRQCGEPVLALVRVGPLVP